MRAALAEERGAVRGPTIGARTPRPVIEIVERDDGLIDGSPAARYLGGPDEWQPFDRRALDRMDGTTLDIGTGAGRLALALQDKGINVVALDISPGAVEVARERGVRHAVCATVDDHAGGDQRYDCFALFGNNLGLIESRERAPAFLAALAAMARPGARIVAQGTDPTGTTDPLHRAYQERNRAAGRLAGQLTIRIRHRDLASEWFTYLLCTPDELGELIRDSAWRLEEIDDAEAPQYVATLRLRAGAGA
jgi:SAM-dependent methyltransferase